MSLTARYGQSQKKDNIFSLIKEKKLACMIQVMPKILKISEEKKKPEFKFLLLSILNSMVKGFECSQARNIFETTVESINHNKFSFFFSGCIE